MNRQPQLPMTAIMDMIPQPKRRASKKRPTARTLERLRDNGHEGDVVERFIKAPQLPGGGIRKDLLGCIDVVAIIDCQIWGIQCGADSGHSGHKKKCMAEPRLMLWLSAGGRFRIESWGKKGGIGKQKRWTCRIEELTLADFATTQELDLFG